MEAAFLYMHYEQLLFEGKDDFYSSKTANKMRQQVKALLRLVRLITADILLTNYNIFLLLSVKCQFM